MTMPDERLRAIGWGGDLLQQIASDVALRKATTDAAQRIALTYPTLQALEHRMLSGACGLPPAWTTALCAALELFDEMRAGGLGSVRTRNDLVYTLRHYPDRMTIRTMSRAATLSAWLERPSENRFDQSVRR